MSAVRKIYNMPAERGTVAKVVNGVEIERGVPMPLSADGGRRAVLRAMMVGDSILVGVEEMEHWRRVSKHIGVLVKSKRVSASQRRIWRVEGKKKGGAK